MVRQSISNNLSPCVTLQMYLCEGGRGGVGGHWVGLGLSIGPFFARNKSSFVYWYITYSVLFTKTESILQRKP